MTDNEIIKDLKVWVDLSELTEKPPFVTHEFLQQLLDLINRRQAEIERLRNALMGECMLTKCSRENEIKSEAIKEFADRLKKCYTKYEPYETLYAQYIWHDIDKLLKELTEPTKIEHNSLCETETYKSR